MTAREWLDHGTQLFLAELDRLSDSDLNAGSALPGWTRRHLVAHVHYNAQALGRLLTWARTGAEARMYEGTEQRAAEIEAGAALPPERLRDLVHESAQILADDMDSLPATKWGASVLTAHGRTVPATEIVWMRAREVAVHSIDLATGLTFSALPEQLNTALALDVVTKRAGKGEAAELAEWLTGRSAQPPTLGPWL